MTILVKKTPASPEVVEHYAALGRFVVEFEHLCHAMGSVVVGVLEYNGLREPKLAQALIAGLTAEPLRRSLEALIADTATHDKVSQTIVRNILARIQSLTEMRNNVVHRTWFIGWSDVAQSAYRPPASIKLKKSKSGVAPNFLNYSAADFDRLSEQAVELSALTRRIGTSLLSATPLAARFVVETDGTVRAGR